MATKLATIIADFSTSLATKIAVGGTTATLQSATDDDGVALPSGEYSFTLNGDNSQKEYIIATLSGTSLTAIKSVTRQGVQSSGTVREHRVGSSVTITNFTHIKYINDLLDGTTDLDADTPLGYDGDPGLASGTNKLATVNYVDGVAIAGGADASTTVKGISKLSAAPVSPTNPIAVGDNDARVPTQDENDALAGTSGLPSSSNPYVTNDDVTEAKTASKIPRRDANSDVLVATTPTAGDAATSKTYVDGKVDIRTKLLAVKQSDQAIASNLSETAILSATVTGGDLGTSGAITGKLFFEDLDLDSGSPTRTLTIRLKYGSTTLASQVLSYSASAAENGYIDFSLVGAGTTSTQVGYMDTWFMQGSSSSNQADTKSVLRMFDGGTSSEDSTGDLTFSVTVDFSHSSVNDKITVKAGSYAYITNA